MPDKTVPLWGRWEKDIEADSQTRPATEFSVEFTSPSGRRIQYPGFWKGFRTWSVRFMPDEEGEWRYTTQSTPEQTPLHHQSGTFFCERADSDNPFLTHGPLRVALTGRHFEHKDGTPFFWLADTVWNGALLSTPNDWETFLKNRVDKHFTSIQFVTHAPWVAADTNAEGEVAYCPYNTIPVNPHFFNRIDARLERINARGLLAIPVLTWEGPSLDPESMFSNNNPAAQLNDAHVIQLARYQVARFGAQHVIWILPGDGNYEGAYAEKWKRIGRAVFGDRPHAPVLIHPRGRSWPYDAFYGESWLEGYGYQSGHGLSDEALIWNHSGPPATAWIAAPPRPVINLEPCYEDHHRMHEWQSGRRISPHDVRRACYWSLLEAPTAGLTYGASGIWNWGEKEETPPRHERTGVCKPWHVAQDFPGAFHMKHMLGLFAALRWWTLVPDQKLFTKNDVTETPRGHVSAAKTQEGDQVIYYLPVGNCLELCPPADLDTYQVQWFDPRTGAYADATGSDGAFRSPDEQDWILLLKRSA